MKGTLAAMNEWESNPNAEPMLDWALGEVVGRQSPPDLSARILAAAAARQAEATHADAAQAEVAQPAEAAPRFSPVLPQPIVLPPAIAATNGHAYVNGSANGHVNGSHLNGAAVHVASVAGVGDSLPSPTERAKRASHAGRWMTLAAAVGVAALVVYGQFARQNEQPLVRHNQPEHPSHKIATNPPQNQPELTSPEQVRPAPPRVPATTTNVESIAKSPATQSPTPLVAPEQVVPQPAPQPEPPQVVIQPAIKATVPTKADAEVIALVNLRIRAGWESAHIVASPVASEEEWCRRVYLDVIGRIPTPEELTAFLREKSPDKKEQLVNQLLDNDLEYARHWSGVWSNLLIGRAGGMDTRRPVSRAGLAHWLRGAFATNMPFDKFASELVAADGANTPGEANFHGAVNFLLDNLENDGLSATNKVSELFLGSQISCAQCHDHPFNDVKQRHFWELNAFFRQAQARMTVSSNGTPFSERRMPGKPGPQSVVLIDEDFVGEERPVNPNEAAIFYERRNGFLKVAYPEFDGQRINPAGYASVVNRRDALAGLLVQSPQFSRAIVNRLWAQFFGQGFVMPVGDMGSHNAPSHPELLASLSDEFVSHGYDVKRLIRWMTLSEAYSLSSRVSDAPKPEALQADPLLASNGADDPDKLDRTRGDRVLFSRFYPRQLQAEQVYESLRIAGQKSPQKSLTAQVAALDNASLDKAARERDTWVQQFVLTFETDDNNEMSVFDGSVGQTLVMMNGDLVTQATSVAAGSFLSHVLESQSTTPKRIEAVYRAALARKPSAAEVTAAQRLWQVHRGDATLAMQDLYWALLNSNEFILNH